MRSIVFDSSAIISIATNNLLWVLKSLKEKFRGNFYITESVKEEIIDYPIKTKKFKLEAMQILSLISDGVLEVYSNDKVKERSYYFSNLINNMFEARGEFIQVVQKGEMESLALVEYLSSNAFVIDERTTRVIIENPLKLLKLLGRKLHTKIKLNKNSLKAFKVIGDINVIRTSELLAVAFELGILDKYIEDKENLVGKDLKRDLLDGVLWGLKLKGCAISSNEINELLRLEGFKGKR